MFMLGNYYLKRKLTRSVLRLFISLLQLADSPNEYDCMRQMILIVCLVDLTNYSQIRMCFQNFQNLFTTHISLFFSLRNTNIILIRANYNLLTCGLIEI